MNRQLLDHMDSWTAKFRNVSPVSKVCLVFKNKCSGVKNHLCVPSMPKEVGRIAVSEDWGGLAQGDKNTVCFKSRLLRCVFDKTLVFCVLKTSQL